jgi:hypothetical protein
MKYGQKVFGLIQPGSVYKPKKVVLWLCFGIKKSNIDTRLFTSLVVCACIAVNPIIAGTANKMLYIN